MKAFHNLKIGVKLMGGFTGVALILVVGAVVGYWNMKAINDGVTGLYSERMVPVQFLTEADAAVHQMRGEAFRFVLVPEERGVTERAINADIATVKAQMDQYRATSSAQEDQAA